jgi:hypothetical protein
LFWSPWDDDLWVRAIDIHREGKPVTQEPGIPFWSRVIDVAEESAGKFALAPMIKHLPGSSTPIKLMIGFELLKLQYSTQLEEVVRTPWAIHYRDGIDMMTVYDMEFAFPIDIQHPLRAVKAIRKLVEIVEKYALHGKFPKEKKDEDLEDVDSPNKGKIHFPLSLCMEMRVMKKSKALLCPASVGNEEHIAFIEILSTSGTRGYEQFFTEVGMEWIKLDGVPHWQKQWELLNQPNFNVFEYLRGKYGKNLDTFLSIYKQLDLDPDGIFMNETMKKLLLTE